MFGKRKGASGAITVFLSLLLIPMLAFGTVVAEAGRYRSACGILAEAQTVASMSVLADYNVYLQDRFGLLAIDPETEGESHSNTFSATLRYNSDNSEDVSNASSLYEIESIEFSTIYKLNDINVLKRQVLEHAKYSVPYTVLSEALDLKALAEELVKKFMDSIGIGTALDTLNDMFSKSESSVNALDKAFNKLAIAEYYTFKSANYFRKYSSSTYTTSSYTTELYETYVKNNSAIGSLSTSVYNDKYVALRDAVSNLVNYLWYNPDPGPLLTRVKSEQETLLNSTTNDTTFNKNLYMLIIATALKSKDGSTLEDDSTLSTITFDSGDLVSIWYKEWSYWYNEKSLDSYSISSYGRTSNRTMYNAAKNLKTYSYKVGNKSYTNKYKTINTYQDLKDLLLCYCGTDYISSNNVINYTALIEKCQNYISNYYKIKCAKALRDTLQTKKNDWDAAVANRRNAVTNAKQPYLTAINEAKSLITNYSGALESAIKELKTAKDNYSANSTSIEAQYSDVNMKAEISTSGDIITAIEDVIKDLEGKKQKLNASKLLTDLTTIYNNVQAINANLITKNSGYFTESDGVSSERLYSYLSYDRNAKEYPRIGFSYAVLRDNIDCSFASVKALCNVKAVNAKELNVELSSSNVSNITNGLSELWAAFESIAKTLTPVPTPNDSSYNQVISSATSNLFSYAYSSDNDADYAYAETLIEKGEDILGIEYPGGWGKGETSDGNNLLANLNSLFDKVNKIKENANKLLTLKFLEMVKAVKEILGLVGDVIKLLGNILTSFFSFVSNLAKQAYYSLLLNCYITQKFPSRMSPVAEAAVVEDTAPNYVQYFKGACVEYIVHGNLSEISNQNFVYWVIFGIRAIINCIQIFMDPTLMSIVSACNIFGIIVFIAFVYMESIIDMNLMIKLGKSVDFWKGTLHLSVNGMQKILGDVVDIKNGTIVYYAGSGNGKRFHRLGCRTMTRSTEVPTTIANAMDWGYTACKVCTPLEKSDQPEGKGYLSMDYDKYLWFLLLFVGEDDKLQRLGNLIQMETRYYEFKNKGDTSFLMSKAGTYVRSSVKASYDSVLPSFSLGENTNSFPELSNIEYVGY